MNPLTRAAARHFRAGNSAAGENPLSTALDNISTRLQAVGFGIGFFVVIGLAAVGYYFLRKGA